MTLIILSKKIVSFSVSFFEYLNNYCLNFDCSNLTNLTLVTTKLRSKTNGERTIPHGFLDDQCYKLSACDSIIFSAIKIDFDFIDSSINK